MRLLEIETAMAAGIPADEWYTFPLIEREQMVAVRLADQYINGLSGEEALKKSRKSMSGANGKI